MMHRIEWGFSGLFLLLSLLVGPAVAQQTDNYQLRAVPAPMAGVVLDGKLNEWDLSGEMLSCYDLDTMRDSNSVRTAAMYDKDFLYLSFRFKDATPLVNHVDPVNEVGCGWRSDSIQLRLWADHEKPIGPGGARIAHLDCYWYTDGKRPSAHLTYHDMSRGKDGFEATLPEVIGQGVYAAFALDNADPSTPSIPSTHHLLSDPPKTMIINSSPAIRPMKKCVAF